LNPDRANLSDGRTVRLRKTRDSDREGLGRLLAALSVEGIEARFPDYPHGDRTKLLKELLPEANRFSIVAQLGSSLVAQGGYRILSGEAAEVGIVVAPAFQGKGLGSILLTRLSTAAAESGIRVFDVSIRARDYSLMDYVKSLGFPTQRSILPGKIRMSFPTSRTHAAVEAFEQRATKTASASVGHFFRPRSIAVIGASREKGSIGGELFRNLIETGFNGPVYPVNRNADVVQSVAAYKSVLECPGPVDLAFLVVPARFSADIARECADKGVRALVVISSGFAEIGPEGAALQRELVNICKGSGMRMIGPNCMGIVNTDPNVGLNGQFSPFRAIPGKIGFWSQSGALGIAVMDLANRLGIGLAEFVSAGNRADVSGNDIIQYWEDNDNIDVILLYIESFGDSRRFARLAKRVTRKKPIVAVKSGRSVAGFRATQSHTGALLAASDVTVDALFRESGVIRTDSLDEMFDVAAMLSTQPVPQGNRVAIITNAGGAGILAADACESMGLVVPELSRRTQEKLRKFLLPIAGTRNPVDMSGGATPTDYASAIKAVSGDAGIDSMIVIFIPPIAERATIVASEILRGARDMRTRLPIVSTFMASKGVSGALSDGKNRIPSYPFPELAVQALARVTQYGQWLKSPQGTRPNFEVRRSEASALVAESLGAGVEWFGQSETETFLKCYGIQTVRSANTSGDPQQVAQAARSFIGKVALKAIAPGLIHKTDAGAVKVGVDPEEVENTAESMSVELKKKGYAVSGFVVQEMVYGAVEMFVGVTHDPTFGPLIACGAGGTLVELINDVSVGLTPLVRQDAERMIRSLKTYKLLDGYRGAPKCDIGALEETVLRLAQMVEEIPEVTELDLNPLMVLQEGKGALVVDARIRVAFKQ